MTWCNKFIERNLPNSSWWGLNILSPPEIKVKDKAGQVPSAMFCFQALRLGTFLPYPLQGFLFLPGHAGVPGGCSAPTAFTSSHGLKDNSMLMTPQVCLLSTGLSPKLPSYTCTCVWEVPLGNPTGTSDSCPLMILLHRIYLSLPLQAHLI